MDKQLKEKWIEMAVREVSTQCQLAKAAFEVLLRPPSTDIAFLAIQAFLSHCANVSKMLQAEQEPRPIGRLESGWRTVFGWLRRWRLYKRRPTIGDLLGIDKSSAVHNEGREFRNNLEHYEHRLFKWLSNHGVQVGIGDFNVMPKSAVQAPKGAFIYVRNLDPKTQTFTFVDKDLDLRALVDELVKIKATADKQRAR